MIITGSNLFSVIDRRVSRAFLIKNRRNKLIDVGPLLIGAFEETASKKIALLFRPPGYGFRNGRFPTPKDPRIHSTCFCTRSPWSTCNTACIQSLTSPRNSSLSCYGRVFRRVESPGCNFSHETGVRHTQAMLKYR